MTKMLKSQHFQDIFRCLYRLHDAFVAIHHISYV